MKILILYFSGTGNTYFLADKIRNKLHNKNYDTTLSSVEKFQPYSVLEYDILILGYPIFACDMPKFLQKFMNNITVPKTKKAILFCTMGMYSGNASRKIGKRLIHKGIQPLHFEEIKMPGSDGLVYMDKQSRMVQKIKNKNYNELEKINIAVNNIVNVVNSLANPEFSDVKMKFPRLKLSGVLLEWFVNKIYNIVEEKMKSNFRADDKCINCHLCEKICPASNIVVKEGKVAFDVNCYLCMRCINQCPVEAIQIGTKTEGKFRWKGPTGDYSSR